MTGTTGTTTDPGPRPRRRAVGPAGARARGPEPLLGLLTAGETTGETGDQTGDPGCADDARLLADRPPHHDQGL